MPQTVMPDFLAVNRELPAKPEAEAKPAQERAEAFFGHRILAADAGAARCHYLPSDGRGPRERRLRIIGKGNALSLARGLGCVTVLCVPRKIRQLVADLERVGFVLVPGGKGSHRKFRHQKFPGALILSGHDGDDAHHYQEKQVRNAIRAASK